MSDDHSIVLVDGYSQIYRSFYAIRGLTNSRGEASNALYGMARFMLMLNDGFDAAYGAVALDKGKPEHRLELIPEYKATRPPMPDDLRSQLPGIRRWIEACGWPILEQDGLEADDIIAGVVSVRDGRSVSILTHDKDLAQLVRDDVVMLAPGKKGEMARLDRQGVEDKFGVAPEQIVDYLSLLGDSVDNIQGVSGIGAKTAAKLLSEFGGIDEVLDELDSVKRDSVRRALRESAAILERNRDVVRLREELPEHWEGIESVRRRPADWPALLEIAKDQGFKSLVSTIQKQIEDERNPRLF
jgi:DNA polymerase-1